MNALLTATDTGFTDILASISESVQLDLVKMTASIDEHQFGASSPGELKNELSAQIYKHLHIRNPLIDTHPTTGEQDLAAQFIPLVPHRSIWQVADRGFESSASVDGESHVIVKLGGVKVLLPQCDVRRDTAEETLTVRLPSWRVRTTPGYLLVLGELSPGPSAGTARLYFSCETPAQALELFPALLRTLAASGKGYHLKALSSSLAYPRSDAIVAYVPAVHAIKIADMLSRTITDLTSTLNSLSIFTQPLGNGIALAEESIDQRPSHRSLSFGQHRSRVLADALFREDREKIGLPQAWNLEAVEARIDPNQPSANL